MAILNRPALVRLARHNASPCLSAFAALGTEGGQRTPGARLRAALKAAVRRAAEERVGSLPDRETLLAPVLGLLSSDVLGFARTGGLAVFWGPSFFCYFLLPHRFPASARVGERFYFRPLLPLLAQDGIFWILTLGRKRIRLLQAAGRLARELDTRDLPVSLSELLSYDAQRRTWRFHSGVGCGSPPAELWGAPEGPSYGDPSSGSRAVRWLRDVDRSLQRLMGTRRRALVVVGENRLPESFCAQSTYPQLLHVSAPDTDALDAQALCDLAWAAAEPSLRAERAAALRQLERAWQKNDKPPKLQQVAAAAAEGRVSTLFVDPAIRWGEPVTPRFAPAEGGAETAGAPATLIERAVLETYLRGGRVYAFRDGERLLGRGAAAIIHEQPVAPRHGKGERSINPRGEVRRVTGKEVRAT